MIDYDHDRNAHSLTGPRAALPVLLSGEKPRSLLDVGCGRGTWLKAAQELGIPDVFGLDGVPIPPDQLLVPPALFRQQNFGETWNLGRKFDAALCLEVAEHLAAEHGPTLLDSLVAHSDLIFFSAASPEQGGQHHVNCRWPTYWQQLFNERGYVCADAVRWQIWNDERIESWYRQNVFVARRDRARAGQEARLHSVIHPGILQAIIEEQFSKALVRIEQGRMPFAWYFKNFLRAAALRVRRRLSPNSHD